MPGVMKVLLQYLAVAGGGALGAVARLGVVTVCGRWIPTSFPLGTFIVNVSGSFLLGWFYASIAGRLIVSDTIRLAVMAGFLGAFTTFSTFAFESDKLMRDGAALTATANLLASVVLALVALRAGMWLGGS